MSWSLRLLLQSILRARRDNLQRDIPLIYSLHVPVTPFSRGVFLSPYINNSQVVNTVLTPGIYHNVLITCSEFGGKIVLLSLDKGLN